MRRRQGVFQQDETTGIDGAAPRISIGFGWVAIITPVCEVVGDDVSEVVDEVVVLVAVGNGLSVENIRVFAQAGEIAREDIILERTDT